MAHRSSFYPTPELSPAAGSKAEKLVVMLHGVGSDGYDLISLAPILQHHFPNFYFFAPHGPENYDMAPFGYQWFSLQDRTPEILSSLAEKNARILEDLIKGKQQELSLGNKDTIILGFSQGTMMGVYLALTQKQDDPFCAVIAYSGRLIKPIKITNTKTPVFIAHGEDDDVVPASCANEMYDFMEKMGSNVEKIIIPSLKHSIDNIGIKKAVSFVKKLETKS